MMNTHDPGSMRQFGQVASSAEGSREPTCPRLLIEAGIAEGICLVRMVREQC